MMSFHACRVGVAVTKTGLRVMLLLGAFACAQAAAAATVFKWTDQRGVVNYSTAPPPEARNVVAVDASPAIGPAGSEEEVRYWRERRAGELARDKRELEMLRQKREADQFRHDQYRQQLALNSQAYGIEEERRRLAREQCLRERRVDCDSVGGYGYGPYYPTTIVARRPPQSIHQAAPFPVNGPASGPVPGTIAGTQAQLEPFRAATQVASRPASVRLPK